MNKLRDRVLSNNFCTYNPSSRPSFRRWDEIDASIYLLNRFIPGSVNYLDGYKDAYVKYNRNLILKYAHIEQIPPNLLAGVARIEAGGKPDMWKLNTIAMRQWREQAFNLDKTRSKGSNETSTGIVAIQIRHVADMMGFDSNTLTTTDQLEIANCLQIDEFNIKMVARHLRDLILYDYPNADTKNLTKEQYIMAGSRYNRGITREKRDFIRIMNTPPELSTTDEKKWISYGVSIYKRLDYLDNLLQG
ncbi:MULTISPECIES: hypothetical protein [Photorhabdus]|uniref:Uncharacterized protein n=1 Tax=Photorhabdus hindustanensis TaxID=2918802 RepID=A0A2S8Q4H2_9GAMM|nr:MULTISPECIES: hypothetical protein [Photorhabdus]MBS9432370.1 hypothetical protein [Photorhabdus hainanensis]PQQ27102.1 hypothetical protein C6H66_07535 [Photorhabdus hindustanensis]